MNVTLDRPGWCMEIFKTLHTFYKQESYCDVIVACHDKKLFSHSCVLAAASPWVASELQCSTSDEPVQIINLEGTTSHVAQYILTFMYTGQVKVPFKYMKEVQELVSKLRIKGLDSDEDEEPEPVVISSSDVGVPPVDSRGPHAGPKDSVRDYRDRLAGPVDSVNDFQDRVPQPVGSVSDYRDRLATPVDSVRDYEVRIADSSLPSDTVVTLNTDWSEVDSTPHTTQAPSTHCPTSATTAMPLIIVPTTAETPLPEIYHMFSSPDKRRNHSTLSEPLEKRKRGCAKESDSTVGLGTVTIETYGKQKTDPHIGSQHGHSPHGNSPHNDSLHDNRFFDDGNQETSDVDTRVTMVTTSDSPDYQKKTTQGVRKTGQPILHHVSRPLPSYPRYIPATIVSSEKSQKVLPSPAGMEPANKVTQPFPEVSALCEDVSVRSPVYSCELSDNQEPLSPTPLGSGEEDSDGDSPVHTPTGDEGAGPERKGTEQTTHTLPSTVFGQSTSAGRASDVPGKVEPSTPDRPGNHGNMGLSTPSEAGLECQTPCADSIKTQMVSSPLASNTDSPEKRWPQKPSGSRVTDKSNRIFMTMITKSRFTKKGKPKVNDRVWNKPHFCFACPFSGTNLAKHIRTHRENKEVSELLAAEQKGTDVRNHIHMLTLRGDHRHNLEVIKQGSGEMVMGRRTSKDTFNVDEYGPCPNCFLWLRESDLARHFRQSCLAKLLSKGPDECVSEQNMLFTSRLLKTDPKIMKGNQLVVSCQWQKKDFQPVVKMDRLLDSSPDSQKSSNLSARPVVYSPGTKTSNNQSTTPVVTYNPGRSSILSASPVVTYSPGTITSSNLSASTIIYSPGRGINQSARPVVYSPGRMSSLAVGATLQGARSGVNFPTGLGAGIGSSSILYKKWDERRRRNKARKLGATGASSDGRKLFRSTYGWTMEETKTVEEYFVPRMKIGNGIRMPRKKEIQSFIEEKNINKKPDIVKNKVNSVYQRLRRNMTDVL